MLRVTLAALHLIALGLGMGAVLGRGNSLLEPVTAGSVQRALRADALWGIAAGLWLVTGAWRLAAGLEKPTGFYTHNHFFFAKMGCFALILVLEVWPMLTLMRWRRALRRSHLMKDIVAPSLARRIAMISHTEALLVLLMVIFATAMARGYGLAP
jgi:putative membrane protein